MKMRYVTLKFEVSLDLNVDDLHEALCLAIYEEDQQAIRTLCNNTACIEVVSSEIADDPDLD